MAQALQEDPVIVINYASGIESNDSASPYGMIALGVVLGLVLGMMLALLAEYMDKRREA